MSEKWVVKRNYPNESTMMIFSDKKEAEDFCRGINERYQSDDYYIELYDTRRKFITPEDTNDIVQTLNMQRNDNEVP